MLDKVTFFRRLAEAVMRAFARFFGFAYSAVGEAFEPVTRRLPALRDALGLGVSGAAIAAGVAIEGPARVLDATAGAAGAALGALVPRRAPTPEDVADTALANDNAAGPAARAPAMSFGETVIAHARVRLGTQSGQGLPRLRGDTADWLASLSPSQLSAVSLTPVDALERHLRARSRAECVSWLPAPEALRPEIARERARIAQEIDVEVMRLRDERLRDPAVMEEMRALSEQYRIS